MYCTFWESLFFYGRGTFIISLLVLEQVSSLAMELVLVKAVQLLDWSGKIGNREDIRLCKELGSLAYFVNRFIFAAFLLFTAWFHY
jgi:hypothetical protein